MKIQNNTHMRLFQQKRILHKYVRWMYELLADGRFYDLPTSKGIKEIDLPDEGSYHAGYIPLDRRVKDFKTKPIYEWRVKYFEEMYHCSDKYSALYDKFSGELLVQSVYHKCNSRWCPVCQVRKSIAEYSKLMFTFNQFGNKYDYFLLTLTLPSNKEGFGDELKLYKKCLTSLFAKFGYNNRDGVEDLCAGAYGSYEITYNEEHGWHPHLHIILAYPKEYIKNYQEHVYLRNNCDKVRYLDEIDIKGVKRNIKFSYDDVVKFWVDCVKAKTDKYNDYFVESAKKHYKGNEWLDVNFCKIDDLQGGVNELSKYLIDFTQINNADMLYVYMRDAHGTKQRLKRGCFIWSDEMKVAYNDFRNQLASDRKHKFCTIKGIDNPYVVKGTVSWNSTFYLFSWNEWVSVRKPYTSTFVDKLIPFQIKIPWDKKLE